ncbi:hypothetical protein GCM10009680_42680 [Streptomyces yatensis]|uniref:Uncharacterized protein n=1 Tax=Streptomyces yatensis TaxID=155177 RepID=A0ABP4U631_9ACTN
MVRSVNCLLKTVCEGDGRHIDSFSNRSPFPSLHGVVLGQAVHMEAALVWQRSARLRHAIREPPEDCEVLGLRAP